MSRGDRKIRRRRVRAVLLGVGLGLACFEVALQVAAFVVWRSASREGAPRGDRHVVLCVGDSFTYGLGASSAERSYPAQLQERLDAARPSEFEVVNGGWAGQSTADVVRRFREQLARYRPEHVVVLAGYNDRWKKPEPVERAELDRIGAEPSRGFPLRLRTLDLADRVLGALRGETAGSPDPAGELVGTWTAGDVTVHFGRDGICAIAGIQSRYRVDGRTLVVDPDRGTRALTLTWERRGERLMLRGGTLLADGWVLARAPEGTAAPTARTGRRVIEDVAGIEALDEAAVVRACADLAEHPEESPLWWSVAAAAARGVGREHVLAAVGRALGRVPRGDPWRAGLLRIRAGILERDDPDAALAATLEAALVDEADYTVATWLETRAADAPRAAFDAALERLHPSAEDRARLERMFTRVTVGTDRVGAVLTRHLELLVELCRGAGASVVLCTYPEPEPVVSPAIRRAIERSGARSADAETAFTDALRTRPHEELFVMDGHCTDAGYALLADVVARALLEAAPR